MEVSNEYKLGDKIVFNKYYKRVSEYKQLNKDNPYKKMYKEWVPFDRKEAYGIVIGFRNISNGFVDYDDEVSVFMQRETIKAVLVCFSLYRKPILIPLIAIRKETNGEKE